MTQNYKKAKLLVTYQISNFLLKFENNLKIFLYCSEFSLELKYKSLLSLHLQFQD